MPSPVAEPTHADQLLRPFRRVLRRYPQIPTALLDALDAYEPGQRHSVATSQELLRGAVVLTGDQDIGLRAAQETEVGDYEVFEYAAASAPTWGAGFEALIRYSKLINTAADFRLQVDGTQARVVFRSTVPLTRAGVDFQQATFFVGINRWRLPVPAVVTFQHQRPADTSAYEATFDGCKLCFGAQDNAFEFEAALLQMPLRTADVMLHGVLARRANQLLEAYIPGDGLVARVRADILRHLSDGRPGVERTAGRLGTSRRSLTRHLQQEGTTFSGLLQEVRMRMAKDYLRSTASSVEDIAFLVGFSESPPFVRAFKRWTGLSPLDFRQRCAAGPKAPPP